MLIAADDDFFAHAVEVSGFLELFEFLPGITFYAKDRKSRFVAANSTMLASKRLTRADQILGKSDFDFHPPTLAAAYIAEDRGIMSSGKALANQSWFIIDQNGAPGWFRSSKSPIFSRNGEVLGLAGVRYPILTSDEMNRQFEDLASAILYIEENYAEAISTEKLANVAGLSVTHFNRRFSQMLRTSPCRFVIAVRIERARHLLTSTENSVGDIAIETGFYDQSHFTRHFQKITGLTPLRYRHQFCSDAPGDSGVFLP